MRYNKENNATAVYDFVIRIKKKGKNYRHYNYPNIQSNLILLPNESDPDIFISQLGQVYQTTPIKKL